MLLEQQDATRPAEVVAKQAASEPRLLGSAWLDALHSRVLMEIRRPPDASRAGPSETTSACACEELRTCVGSHRSP